MYIVQWVNQAATYPSPYANAHKNDMCTPGGTTGLNSYDKWTQYTNDLRDEHVKKVNTFLASLPTHLSSRSPHDKLLAFVAENGVRQLGPPRIGIFVERVRSDPLHREINAWQHLLDLIYSVCNA